MGRRFWISLMLLVAVVASATDAAAQTPDNRVATSALDRVNRAIAAHAAPQNPLPQDPFPPTLPDDSSGPFWTARRAYIIGGFSAAAAAGAMSWMKERDLRVLKRELQSLPAGSNDEWTRRRDEAERTLRDRNFWGAVAGGVGAVTLIYMFTSNSSRTVRPLPGGAAFVWSF